MKPIPGDGIVLRSILLTVLAFFLAGIGIFAFTYHATAERAARNVDIRLNQLLDTIYSTLSIACFLKDQSLAEDVATGLLKSPEVLHVLIQADEITLVDAKRAGEAPVSEAVTLPPLERVVTSPFTPDKKVGMIRLSPNPEVIAQQRSNEIQRAAEQLLWQLLVVSGAIGTALIVFVARPISHISERLHTMDPLQGERLPIPSGHLNTELGRLVGDINRLADRLALTIAEARQDRASAEAASEAKSQFLASLSREIRAPLTTIRQIARLGARQGESAIDQEHFGRIDKAGAQLQATIDDVLDFSRIEAGKLVLENNPCKLTSLVADAVAAVEQHAAAKGLELVCRQSDSLPEFILGDPARIRQILVTLLMNAVRHSSHGSIVLTVLSADDELWFSVRDEGVGMTREEITNAFRAFAHDDQPIDRSACGTRLALPIAMNLASLMGGTIQAVSTPWHGSTFTLQLPLRPADQSA
ncbi:sensor histidine kinase [Sulfuricystis multivorans]|uniref:sensor histidine kinase n=1 Tax=Sulfuricystis multivorans TaxID=2211108 RepID=UPI000F81D388|nr:ATP-binding protein [Sulfuricystis multivorans]